MFSSLLLKIVPFKGWIIAAAAAAVLAVIGGQYVEVQHLHATVATDKAAFAAERQAAATAALKASEAQRAIEEQRLKDQREAEDEATHEIAIAQIDRDAALAAAGRLQSRYAAALAALRKASGNPPVVAGGAPAEDPVAVLADVQRRTLDAAGQLAAAADASRIAGLACEAEYDSLKPTAP